MLPPIAVKTSDKQNHIRARLKEREHFDKSYVSTLRQTMTMDVKQ